MSKSICHWRTGCPPVAQCAIAARDLGAAEGPKKPKGSRYSEMHSQPFLRPK